MGQTALLPLRRKACWGFFSPWKIRRLRSGLNPRSWVPKASTLPLDHRSRSAPLYPQQISNGQTWDRTRASTLKGRRLTNWVMIVLHLDSKLSNQLQTQAVLPQSSHVSTKQSSWYHECKEAARLAISHVGFFCSLFVPESKNFTLLTFQSPRLTLCTTSFNIHKFCVLLTTHLCVLCGSENKQRLFPYTALTDWFV